MRKFLGMRSQSCLPGLGLRQLGGREEFTVGLGKRNSVLGLLVPMGHPGGDVQETAEGTQGAVAQ